MASYFRFNYVPEPHSIYRGVKKLPPGSMLTWEPGGGAVSIERYWNMRDFAGAPPRERDPVEAVEELDRLLRDAVGRQMMADVPLGAFLSGGIDSSTVVALMQAQSARPVRTFSIGFDEAGYNEATHAARGRRASRHRPHRALCRTGPCPRCDPDAARHLRRAFRRQFPDPDLSGVGDDPAACDGRAVGRRRRRIVRAAITAISGPMPPAAACRPAGRRQEGRVGAFRAVSPAGLGPAVRSGAPRLPAGSGRRPDA